ncbi:DNA (cytosine-5-)-methyltransferase [Levilactobacillus namurensis]|uniref:DNA (cytosine-5-)-methyltransferase n=1 Tax=Levilactobacillus namurensis TaxID=380393 RepID=UPI000464A041|nr:DNA (cytosine-5-)-methyltransferase [Levilactobacillus namurensis]
MNSIRVAELFAGVGGFRLGLEAASDKFNVVWADQYEPSRKAQAAFDVYCERFGSDEIVNDDIAKVNKKMIPDFDLLVGGFPCQDYSVAKSTSKSKGIYGKKGVLWWDILKTVQVKKPRFLFLENVDRLLKSPGVNSINPGRDFGMILRTLSDYHYSVQWKMINAADYGEPQRRRRTFIFAFRDNTKYGLEFAKKLISNDVPKTLSEDGPLNAYLPNDEIGDIATIDLVTKKGLETLPDFSDNFRHKGGFANIGLMHNGVAFTTSYKPRKLNPKTIGELLDKKVTDKSLFLTDKAIVTMRRLRGKNSVIKVNKADGHKYPYAWGSVQFPDMLSKPARTMVTSERSVNRMSHVIEDPESGKLRFISPEEAERINTFPEGWTDIKGISRSSRYFLMGNALVVDLVRKISQGIYDIAEKEPDIASDDNWSDLVDVKIPVIDKKS